MRMEMKLVNGLIGIKTEINFQKEFMKMERQMEYGDGGMLMGIKKKKKLMWKEILKENMLIIIEVVK